MKISKAQPTVDKWGMQNSGGKGGNTRRQGSRKATRNHAETEGVSGRDRRRATGNTVYSNAHTASKGRGAAEVGACKAVLVCGVRGRGSTTLTKARTVNFMTMYPCFDQHTLLARVQKAITEAWNWDENE